MSDTLPTETLDVRYPHVHVSLSGEDGNAMFIIGRVRRALSRARIENAEVDKFTSEAMSGDYGNVLRTCMRWVATS